MTPSIADARACFLQAIPGGPKPAPGVNVILDLVGASHFGSNLESLTVEGKLLLVGLPSGSKAEINLALVRLLASFTLVSHLACWDAFLPDLSWCLPVLGGS